MPFCDLRARFLLGFLLLAGCGRVHLGDHDSGVGFVDAGGPIDGGGPILCGPTICTGGSICCNADCGLCASPGGACPAIECVPGCSSDADCEAGSFCAWPIGACGPTMEPGTCTPLAEVCPPFIHEVCGCDGQTYLSPCEAQGAGVSILSDGPCTVTPCDAQDAVGEGLCPAFLGVAWDGQRCVGIGGCNCVGADCDQLFETQPDCERAHATCTSCAPQEAYGQGFCDLFLGWVWDGMSCNGLSGCSCVGADCMSVYSDLDACTAAHELCEGGCFGSSQCGPGEFCQFPFGACGGPGDCVPIPPELMCTFEAPPVCGCDGVTYGCEEYAYQVGVSVAYEGACAGGTCAAQDAMGSGDCLLFFGYRWNGTACEIVGGCDCVGTECMSLFTEESSCQAAYVGCEPPPGQVCGTIAGLNCRRDEWCDYEDPSWCGGDDGGGICMPRPTGCPDNIDPVCGCDGTIHNNECEANAAGYDIWTDATMMCAGPSPGGP